MAVASSSIQFHSLSSWMQRISTSGGVEQIRADYVSEFGPLMSNRARKKKFSLVSHPRMLFTVRCILAGDGSDSGGGGGDGGDNDGLPIDSTDEEKSVNVVGVEDEQQPVGGGVVSDMKKRMIRFRGEIATALPPLAFTIKRHPAANFVFAFFVATTCLIVAVRVYVARNRKDDQPGTVADLVRRGQLRSDRRGISRPLMYDDPFNNPVVKTGKGNSTVEMCGKVYRLAAVTLTEEQQAIHQKRRSRAYQWKRPTVFLKEGDSIPADVDPDTVRWIPANHPFATTSSDIDEGLAQTNVYQKHGVPFRIQAEHEALQRKLEALQNEQKLNLMIDLANAKDFETSFKEKMKPREEVDDGSQNGKVNQSNLSKSDQVPDPDSDSNSASS